MPAAAARLGVSRWHGVPSSRAARPGKSQLGGAGPGRVCGWRCRARRRPCAFLPSPVRRHRLGESLGTVPGSPLAPPERDAPGSPRSVQGRRCSQVRVQEGKGRADPTAPEAVGAPRCRTERPLTAEQQQQQQQREKVRAPPRSCLHG